MEDSTSHVLWLQGRGCKAMGLRFRASGFHIKGLKPTTPKPPSPRITEPPLNSSAEITELEAVDCSYQRAPQRLQNPLIKE